MRKILSALSLLLLFGLMAGCYGAHNTAESNPAHYEQGLVDKAAATVRGMSNDKTSEKLVRRKPKVSWVKLIFPG